jgi:hypothetical protein
MIVQRARRGDCAVDPGRKVFEIVTTYAKKVWARRLPFGIVVRASLFA